MSKYNAAYWRRWAEKQREAAQRRQRLEEELLEAHAALAKLEKARAARQAQRRIKAVLRLLEEDEN
jgi:hypothetical protein